MSRPSLQSMPEITGDLIERGMQQGRRERALAFGSALSVIRGAMRWRRSACHVAAVAAADAEGETQ